MVYCETVRPWRKESCVCVFGCGRHGKDQVMNKELREKAQGYLRQKTNQNINLLIRFQSVIRLLMRKSKTYILAKLIISRNRKTLSQAILVLFQHLLHCSYHIVDILQMNNGKQGLIARAFCCGLSW